MSIIRVPRLLGTISAVVGTVVLALVVYAAGAGAAPGDVDLSITKTDAPDPIVQGNNLTYTIKVTNPNTTGGADATNVVVTDPLPSGVDFVSATGGSCQKNGSTVTCDLGTVPAATTTTTTIVVKTKKDGTLTNTASVASPEDVVLSNFNYTATTTVSKKPGKQKKPGKASCATPTINGTPGNDVITGTNAGDV